VSEYDEEPHTFRAPNGRYSMFEVEIKRLDQLRQAGDMAVAAALAAAEKAVAAALIASEKAIDKAEAAQLRTNEAQNEFRAQLKDQAQTFLTRNEYGLAHQNLEDKVELNFKEIADLRSRIDVGPPSLSALQRESDQNSGRRTGSLDTRTLVFALLATAASVITIVAYLVKP
jgi:hypothetical protein